ncbi:MAG: hypothetical protein U0132_22325 [Gemmatimonadaceae bacterium]
MWLRHLSLLPALFIAAHTATAMKIPAFARKYNVSCVQCHSPVPKLNKFGENFAANGFEFAKGEAPRDTVGTGDALLRLQRTLPLAVRFDSYITALSNKKDGQNNADFQSPWIIKLLSGGQVADKVSYYTYFLLTERGEVAGLEDAYVQFTDVFGSKASVIFGQFQVSDPVFKRELRLSYDDWQLYRMKVGDATPDLTYDRGLMAMISPWEGADFSVQLLNGGGLQAGTDQQQFDRDSKKNVALRYSQAIGPLRLGGFGYRGAEEGNGVRNTITVWGPDATIPLGDLGEINAQYLRRTDRDPFYGSCSPIHPCPGGATIPFDTKVDAAMAEAVLWPQGHAGRLFFTGTYNWIKSDTPVISLGLGEQSDGTGFLTKYQTLSGGAHFLYKRNLRMMAEIGHDFERKQTRFIAGTVLAF